MQHDPQKEEARLIRRCLSPAGGDVLEVGCGDGRLTADLARVAANLVAVDPSRRELTRARRRVESPVTFVSASGESLPLAAESIDAVVFTLSLHHQQPRQALSEAQRVLKKSGRILVLEPLADSLLSKLFAVLHDESAKYAWVEKAVASSGLKVMRTGSVRVWWVFEDFAEMVLHMFDYFGLKPDRQKQNRMAKLLGDRRQLKPLPIEDFTRFWFLRKR